MEPLADNPQDGPSSSKSSSQQGQSRTRIGNLLKIFTRSNNNERRGAKSSKIADRKSAGEGGSSVPSRSHKKKKGAMQRMRQAAERMFGNMRSPTSSEQLERNQRNDGERPNAEVEIEVHTVQDRGDNLRSSFMSRPTTGNSATATEEGAKNDVEEIGAVALEFYSPQPERPTRPINIPEQRNTGEEWHYRSFHCGSPSPPSGRLRHVVAYEDLSVAPLDDSPWGADRRGNPVSPRPRTRFRQLEGSPFGRDEQGYPISPQPGARLRRENGAIFRSTSPQPTARSRQVNGNSLGHDEQGYPLSPQPGAHLRRGYGAVLRPSLPQPLPRERQVDNSPLGEDEQGFPMSPQPRRGLRRVKKSFNMVEEFRDAIRENEANERNALERRRLETNETARRGTGTRRDDMMFTMDDL